MRSHLIAKLAAVAVIAAGLASCSSSTDSTTPSNSTGTLTTPAAVEFNTVAAGRWHDTTFTVANTYSDSITITGSHFSTSSQAGSTVNDTIDQFPITIPGGKSAILRASYFAVDSGSQSAVDTILYKHGGTVLAITAPVHARGVYAPPGSGSTFTFSESVTDTNGATTKLADSTYTVLSNSTTFAGKSNVIVLRNPAGDTAYYHVESNGDVSQYYAGGTRDISGPYNSSVGVITMTMPPFLIPPAWIVVPLGSHTSLVDTAYTSAETGTVDVPGFGTLPAQAQVILVFNSRYSGTESIAAGPTTFSTQKGVAIGNFNVIVTAGGNTIAGTQIQTNTLWYVPQFEFIAKQINSVQRPFGTKSSSKTEVLTNYSIK